MTRTALIGIVETGAGNICSLEAAIARLGRRSIRLTAPSLSDVDQLVIPGQGRFGPVMQQLRKTGWENFLRDWIRADKPLLGICVGMQILYERSEENSDIKGLGVISERIEKLNSPKQPMMGWADICWRDRQADEQVYFVNSYVAPCTNDTIAYCEYGQTFSAVIQRGNLIASQFHPEKSGATGMRLLQQWLC